MRPLAPCTRTTALICRPVGIVRHAWRGRIPTGWTWKMRTGMRKPATLQRRGPGGLARTRLRSAQGCVRLGAARRQRGLEGTGCGGAVKRPEWLLSSGRLRAAAADQPAARARMEGTEGGVAPLGASAPRARTRLMGQTAPPRSRAAWRANLAKSGCVPKGVPKAWAARWRGGVLRGEAGCAHAPRGRGGCTRQFWEAAGCTPRPRARGPARHTPALRLLAQWKPRTVRR